MPPAIEAGAAAAVAVTELSCCKGGGGDGDGSGGAIADAAAAAAPDVAACADADWTASAGLAGGGCSSCCDAASPADPGLGVAPSACEAPAACDGSTDAKAASSVGSTPCIVSAISLHVSDALALASAQLAASCGLLLLPARPGLTRSKRQGRTHAHAARQHADTKANIMPYTTRRVPERMVQGAAD